MKQGSIIFLLCILMWVPVAGLSKSKKIVRHPKPNPGSIATEVKEVDLVRLNPHGGKDLDLRSTILSEHPECKVCHRMSVGMKVGMKENKMVLNPDIPRRCALCHNKFPHSGVVEHQGRATCIDCHRPHRALLEKLAPQDVPAEPAFHIEKPLLILPEGLIQKKNPDAMLRKNCRECHLWK